MNNIIDFKPYLFRKLSKELIKIWNESGPLTDQATYKALETRTLQLISRVSPSDRAQLGLYITDYIRANKIPVNTKLYGVLGK